MLRCASLLAVLSLVACSRPAAAPNDIGEGAQRPENCEALAWFHGEVGTPNAWALANVQSKQRSCSSGTCLTTVGLDPYLDLRGPEIRPSQGGLAHADAERLVHRDDRATLLAAHVDDDGTTTPVWIYPLYYAAEGESMLALLDAGQCPPVRLPRGPECAGCQPDACATACCRPSAVECAPACCE